ncbi:MAG: ABC transporter permease [Candidatus Cloacimonetes bacterium]|nr:ABC transporter permease [Candidatus Cloacimonadota bacterium]
MKHRTGITLKKRSQAGEIWRRLRQNKASMVGLVIIIIVILMAVFADVIAPYDYSQQNLSERFQGPSLKHLFGTDNFGRDIFSRILFGARISLKVGLISVFVSVAIGGTLGAVAAFYGGKTDNIIMRILDVILAIPGMLLAIAIAATLGAGLSNMMIAIGIGSIPGYARVVRASVLTVKEQDYIEVARSIGASDARIILRHIILNAMAPILVQATLGVAGAILSCASLSFLGLGIEPPTPEWGSMLSSTRQYISQYWWLTAFPGGMIMLTVYALNVLGDGLRDALDPRLKD